MTTIDPNTLDPEQIGKLPVDRSQPLNGLTEEQTRALGLDPTEVEAGRLAQLEWEKAQQLTSDAELVLAARHAVEIGDMTHVEAALALRQNGSQAAHDLFVQEWRAAEHEAENDAEEFIWADADEYLRRTGELDDAATAKAAADETAARAAEANRIAEQIRSKLDATVPKDHPLREGIEAVLIHQLSEEGGAASDDRGQNQAIRAAVQTAFVLDNASESIRQQAEQEWRLIRKERGKTDGLMTQADIDAAKEHYIAGRLQQLGDRKMIAHDDLKPPATADDEKQRQTDRIAARNSASASLREAVGGIEQRGLEAEAARRGVSYGSGSEKDRYRDAVRRAEENARVAPTPEAADAAAVVSRNPGRPDLPPDWVDEYGPAGFAA
jgi:hypothetical protein